MIKHKINYAIISILFCFTTLLTVSCKQKAEKKDNEAVPSLDELAGKWMEISTLRNMPSVNNFFGGLAVTKDISSVKLLTIPPFVLDGSDCNSFLNGKALNARYSRWYPYQVLRKTKIDGMEVTSSTRMVFENRGILMHIEFKNTTQESKNINFKLNLFGKSRKFDKKWDWGYPRVKGNDFDIKVKDAGCLVISDKKSSSKTVYIFPVNPTNLSVGQVFGTADWKLKIARGKTVAVDYVMAIGEDSDGVLDLAKEWAKDFNKEFGLAKTLWEKRWKDVFTRGNSHFSGHLPTLTTTDKKLRRVYYIDIASTLQLYRTNLPVSNRVFATNGPEWGVTLMYFWNMEMWPTVWAMLEPASIKQHLRGWLSMDYHHCYARDYLSGQPSGPWYSANDWSMFRCIDSYLRVTGDKKFLDEKICGKTVLEHLDGLATNYKQFVRKGEILADYGGAQNLLECVPTYINRVASLNAGNVWMLSRMAEIYQESGNDEKVKELNREADRLLTEVLKLYSPGQGVWYSLHRDGKKIEMRHVYDFVMVGKSITNDLSPRIKKEMMAFVKNELLTKNWMRAQSLKDPAAEYSDRPDHGPMGSYDAWPPLSMEVMCLFGEFNEALSFLHRIEEVTYEGPFAQSHELLKNDSVVRIARRGQQNYNDGGAAYADVIIRTFFGFEPQISDKFKILDPDTPRGFSGTLSNISYHGALYTLKSDSDGISILEQ